MNVLAHYQISGGRAADIAASIEDGIISGAISPGDGLPPVRTLAEELGVSPATVAAAYSGLQQRGLVVAEGRRGTRVRRRPSLPVRATAHLPPGVTNLAHGNPDPALLPDLDAYLSAGPTVLYGEEANLATLVDLARDGFRSDGVPADDLAVVGGALDGVERVLASHLRPGDRVAVEDPGYPPLFDLLSAMGLHPLPVSVDREGVLPESLEAALSSGAAALVVTPRAQNPTGACFSPERIEDLRLVLERHPDLVTIEDDHAGPVAGGSYRSLATPARQRWAVVRSVSKSLGPDLRLALVAGDATTVARVEGRQLLGTGWVSHILQRAVVAMWQDPHVSALLERATDAYSARRRALIDALAARGIEATGRTGLNVWVPVDQESHATAALLDAGIAVAAGERYRISSEPGIRITTSILAAGDAAEVAAALAEAGRAGARTRSA